MLDVKQIRISFEMGLIMSAQKIYIFKIYIYIVLIPLLHYGDTPFKFFYLFIFPIYKSYYYWCYNKQYCTRILLMQWLVLVL